MKKLLLSAIGLLVVTTMMATDYYVSGNICVTGNIAQEDFDVTKDYDIMLHIYDSPFTELPCLPMTFKGNGEYEIITDKIGTQEFKIADLAYSVINYGGGDHSVPNAEDYEILKNGQKNMSFDTGELTSGWLRLKVTFSADWSAVLNVRKTTEPTAVINTKAPSDVIVSTSNGTVLAEGEFEIFDMSGKNVTVQNGQLNGNYIVVVNNQSVKILVE